MKEERNKRLNIRLTESEIKTLKVQSNFSTFNNNVSAYCRAILTNNKVISKVDYETKAQLRQHFGLLKKLISENGYNKNLNEIKEEILSTLKRI